MNSIIAGMYNVKQWTPEEVAEFARMAKRKGISKNKLARKWLGVFPTTLSYWMSESKSYREPTEVHRRLLSLVEPIVKRMKDKEVD